MRRGGVAQGVLYKLAIEEWSRPVRSGFRSIGISRSSMGQRTRWIQQIGSGCRRSAPFGCTPCFVHSWLVRTSASSCWCACPLPASPTLISSARPCAVGGSIGAETQACHVVVPGAVMLGSVSARVSVGRRRRRRSQAASTSGCRAVATDAGAVAASVRFAGWGRAVDMMGVLRVCWALGPSRGRSDGVA